MILTSLNSRAKITVFKQVSQPTTLLRHQPDSHDFPFMSPLSLSVISCSPSIEFFYNRGKKVNWMREWTSTHNMKGWSQAGVDVLVKAELATFWGGSSNWRIHWGFMPPESRTEIVYLQIQAIPFWKYSFANVHVPHSNKTRYLM